MRFQSCNRLPRHTVSLNYHLLLNHIRQNLCWILDGYQMWFLGAVPYHVEPVALSVTMRLQPLVGRQFDEFSLACTRLDLDATYLTRLRSSTADVAAASIMVLADILWLPATLPLVGHHILHAGVLDFIVSYKFTRRDVALPFQLDSKGSCSYRHH